MPARRAGGVNTTRRKHSLGNLRRAHPASGATWNVQVVRGKMSSKCLWHACRALILGLTLLLVGAGMATLGYYADNFSFGAEVRGNATVKNDLKGFHLNNFSYVGPIVMGFGGFIVVASCVMTFEARDSAAKVVPARLRAGTGNKITVRSNQSSSASQRRAIDMQFQNTRWDQQFGVFRSSPSAEAPQCTNMPLDREALTAELIKFSKSLSNRQIKNRGTRISNSLIQRTTRESATCSLLQPPTSSNKLFWHAASFDESCRGQGEKQQLQRERLAERTRRSDTAKRHILARQNPIAQEEDRDKIICTPTGNRRCSTMSDSSYSGRWTARCSSIPSRASSIDSRRIQVDLHSPEVMPKSILRSPKRYSSARSTTPSVDKEFRSQLSVCSEPPAAIHQLSGQSSLEPCLAEEAIELIDEIASSPPLSTNIINPVDAPPTHEKLATLQTTRQMKYSHLSLMGNSIKIDFNEPTRNREPYMSLQRSNSSRIYDRSKSRRISKHDDSIFYIRSNYITDFYDSEQVINERRTTLLKADSETALAERKLSSLSIPERILEKATVVTGVEDAEAPEATILQLESQPEKIQGNPLAQDNELV